MSRSPVPPLELDPKYAHCYWALVGSYIVRGMLERAIEALKKGLADIPNEAHLVGALAQLYASTVKVDPQLASLRADPRFHDLVRRMNMAPLKIATSPR